MIVVDIDPVIFALGPIQIRWYGLMYVIGFVIASQLCKKLSREGFIGIAVEKVDSLVTHAIIGMFLGARIFYVFIYNWDYYSDHFTEILSVWQGGLSYHGSIVGFALAGVVFARKNGIAPLQVFDTMITTGAQGVFFGRMGNFINGELYGRITDSPIGMVFVHGGPHPRHPSQLYEGVFEGLILFFIIWFLRKRVANHGMITGFYLMGYAIFRFFIEFFREADIQLGYYFGNNITMGQILCFTMFWAGVIFLLVSFKLKIRVNASS